MINQSFLSKLTLYLSGLVKSSTQICLTLFKLMIPIIIAIKILQELGAIDLLSALLEPVMHWVGLPGSMGLVWATALMTNIYASLVVFVSLADAHSLNVAQVTILSGMILIAHSIPVEVRIAQKAGVSFLFTLLLRIGVAILFGAIFNSLFLQGEWLQQSNQLLWQPQAADASLTRWVITQIQALMTIYLVVLILVATLDLLKKTGVIDGLNRLLRPMLKYLGIGPQAETITMIGVTLGLSYGAGILIKEASEGHIPPKDVLFSMSLLGLSHSLIEDTLLMMLIGAHWWGIVLGRILLSLMVIFLLVKLVNRLSEQTIRRFLVRSVASK